MNRPRGNALGTRVRLGLILACALLSIASQGPGAVSPAQAEVVEGIYVADGWCSVGGCVIRVDPRTGAQWVVAGGDRLEFTHMIAIEANGDLIVDGRFGIEGLVRIDPHTGAQRGMPGTSDSLGAIDPYGVAIGANGDIFVTDNFHGFTVALIRVNPQTGASEIVYNAGTSASLGGIAIAPNGDLFVVSFRCCDGEDGVLRVNPITKSHAVVTAGNHLSAPAALAVADNGDVLVVDAVCCGGRGGVIRVNPVTGAQVIASGSGHFRQPSGIAIAHNGDLLVVDATCCGGKGGVIRVDRTTGAQAIASGNGFFRSPSAIAVAPVLSIDNLRVTEGQGGTKVLTFAVNLAPYTSQTVRVDYATADGTAQAASDYIATSGTLVFAPGETRKTIAVQVIGDTTFEPDETFTVNLLRPSAATVARSSGIATIANDDASQACSPRPNVLVRTERDGANGLQVTVTATSHPAFPTNRLVELRFSPGTNSAIDIQGQTGQTGSFSVPLPNRPQSVTFAVRRPQAGQPSHLPFTVVDDCGAWKTFVGRGNDP